MQVLKFVICCYIFLLCFPCAQADSTHVTQQDVMELAKEVDSPAQVDAPKGFVA